jgi:hypothetical protein
MPRAPPERSAPRLSPDEAVVEPQVLVRDDVARVPRSAGFLVAVALAIVVVKGGMHSTKSNSMSSSTTSLRPQGRTARHVDHTVCKARRQVTSSDPFRRLRVGVRIQLTHNPVGHSLCAVRDSHLDVDPTPISHGDTDACMHVSEPRNQLHAYPRSTSHADTHDDSTQTPKKLSEKHSFTPFHLPTVPI